MSVFGCGSKSTLSTRHTAMPSFRNTTLNVRDTKTILQKTEPSSILLSSGVGCGDYQIRVEKSPTTAYGYYASRNTLKFLVINRYLLKPPYAIGSVPSLSGYAFAYRWRSLPRVRRHRASKLQGSSERVLPWQVTMDQLICTSLSHTHYWYEVGMLKVPAKYITLINALGESFILSVVQSPYRIPSEKRFSPKHIFLCSSVNSFPLRFCGEAIPILCADPCIELEVSKKKRHVHTNSVCEKERRILIGSW